MRNFIPIPPPTDRDRERFWAFVRKTDGCWFWAGARLVRGYGKFTVRKRFYLAHRYSLMLAGTDMRGMCTLHKCDNPPCVRPDHLYAGSDGDNQKDTLLRIGGKVLTASTVQEARQRVADGESVTGVAKSYGLDRTSFSKTLYGRSWKCVEGELVAYDATQSMRRDLKWQRYSEWRRQAL